MLLFLFVCFFVGGDFVCLLGGHFFTVQYGTAQYSTVQYNTVQYSTVQYSTVHSTVQSLPPPQLVVRVV